MERVSSAFRAGEEGVEARQAGCRARVEGSALRFEARTPGQTPAAVTLKTRAIVAGPERLFDERGAALLPRRVRGNTAQLLLEEELGLVEHVEARGRGVEITWVLSSPPPDGDLRVELSVVGLTHAGEDEHGLRFADANGDVRVRMSDAVLVDSSGRRWPAESEVTTFGVRITAKAEHLAQARYPVALDPTFTAEVGVGEPEYQRADGGQHDVTIAHNGHHYLICWVDTRQFSNVTELYCARFTSAGELLAPAGIDVSPTTGSWIASIPLCSSTLARATRA